jgi:hypothetical protein
MLLTMINDIESTGLSFTGTQNNVQPKNKTELSYTQLLGFLLQSRTAKKHAHNSAAPFTSMHVENNLLNTVAVGWQEELWFCTAVISALFKVPNFIGDPKKIKQHMSVASLPFLSASSGGGTPLLY